MQAQTDRLEVTFITCGQTQHEATRLCEDDFSGGLSKLGKEQVSQLAPFVNFKDYKLVICSPSTKAVESCSILFPGKKPMTVALVGPFKFGCLGHHPKEDFYNSLLNSTAPEREFKVKGSENLELVRKRVKEFFTRLACALMWEKQDALLTTSKPGGKILVITHEIFVAELVTYIKERNAKISEIAEGRQTEFTEKSENSDEYILHKKVQQLEATPDVLESYTRYGSLPFEESSPFKKIKVLEAKRVDSNDKQGDRTIGRSKSQDKLLKLTLAEREVPKEYLVNGKCTMTIIAVTCKQLHICKNKPRNELNDDFLQYEILKERSTDYNPVKPPVKTMKRL